MARLDLLGVKGSLTLLVEQISNYYDKCWLTKLLSHGKIGRKIWAEVRQQCFVAVGTTMDSYLECCLTCYSRTASYRSEHQNKAASVKLRQELFLLQTSSKLRRKQEQKSRDKAPSGAQVGVGRACVKDVYMSDGTLATTIFLFITFTTVRCRLALTRYSMLLKYICVDDIVQAT